MKTITVQVADLQRRLTSNLGAHQATFEKAMDEFRRRAVQVLDDQIAVVRAGGLPDRFLRLPIPEEHSADYRRALEMLAWHTEPTIELTEGEFAEYVQDDWGWRQSFISNTTSYVK